MIPKTIHYCWFGGKPIPEEYKAYMDSWRKYLPDYQIVEWNETNFDVNCIPFVKEAYEVGKFAYVSDYALGPGFRRGTGKRSAKGNYGLL